MRKPKQLEFKKVQGWGGKRKDAGRPNRSGTVNHMAREQVDLKKPIHMTLRLRDDIKKSLRTPSMLTKFHQCAEKAKVHGLHVIHFSIESNHLHMIVECPDNEALASGMRSLGCSLGKAIRKYCGGSGPVFKGRYHMRTLKSPREMKNGLAYVLLNQSKHEGLIPYNDRFSSAGYFNDWRKLLGRNIGPILADWRKIDRPLPPHLSHPRSWLAREGWMRAR